MSQEECACCICLCVCVYVLVPACSVCAASVSKGLFLFMSLCLCVSRICTPCFVCVCAPVVSELISGLWFPRQSGCNGRWCHGMNHKQWHMLGYNNKPHPHLSISLSPSLSLSLSSLTHVLTHTQATITCNSSLWCVLIYTAGRIINWIRNVYPVLKLSSINTSNIPALLPPLYTSSRDLGVLQRPLFKHKAQFKLNKKMIQLFSWHLYIELLCRILTRIIFFCACINSFGH